MRYLTVAVLLVVLLAYDPSSPCPTEEDFMSEETPTPIPIEVMTEVHMAQQALGPSTLNSYSNKTAFSA